MTKYSLRQRKPTNYNVAKTLNTMVNSAIKAAKQKRINKVKDDTRRRKAKKMKEKQKWSIVNRYLLGVRMFKLFKRCTPRNKYVDQLYNICYQYDDAFEGDFHMFKLNKQTLDQLKHHIQYFEDQERLLERGIGTQVHIQKLIKKLSLMPEESYPAILETYNMFANKWVSDDQEEAEMDLNFPFPPQGVQALDRCMKTLKF